MLCRCTVVRLLIDLRVKLAAGLKLRLGAAPVTPNQEECQEAKAGCVPAYSQQPFNETAKRHCQVGLSDVRGKHDVSDSTTPTHPMVCRCRGSLGGQHWLLRHHYYKDLYSETSIFAF